MPNRPAISVRHLRKMYGEVVAVDDLTFTVPRGTVLGLLGGNGAGKTTTIAMLLGLLEPTSGQIEVLGVDMLKRRYAALPRITAVRQLSKQIQLVRIFVVEGLQRPVTKQLV